MAPFYRRNMLTFSAAGAVAATAASANAASFGNPDLPAQGATLRSHDQYNTTVCRLDDRYRGVFGGRMVVFMNEADMQQRGIAPASLVEIESLAEDGNRRIVRGFRAKLHDIPPGSIGAYYPETNPLLPLAHHDRKSGTPAAKSIPVLVRPIVTATELPSL
jgi:anaerobic selenocysteine-containing dehydrogenase